MEQKIEPEEGEEFKEEMHKAKEDFFVDPILKKQLDEVRHAVMKRDRDYVMVVDGEEGSGKSVLAMQIAAYLDKKFTIDQVVFNADQFMKKIKTIRKNACLLLDEAFSASNARASLSQVNRSMVGVATEMRQRNLFVIFVLPSFFDLDKYFALWRCRALIHVYFAKDGSRGRYIIFPKTKKKYLYLNGKKTYNYSKPRSPYPPCRFNNEYVIDEFEYRIKKADAFKRRTVSNLAKKWKGQRDACMKILYHDFKVSSLDIPKRIEEYGESPLSQREICRIVQLGGDVME